MTKASREPIQAGSGIRVSVRRPGGFVQVGQCSLICSGIFSVDGNRPIRLLTGSGWFVANSEVTTVVTQRVGVNPVVISVLPSTSMFTLKIPVSSVEKGLVGENLGHCQTDAEEQ